MTNTSFLMASALAQGQAQPYSVHVNMNEGSLKGKRHRLREAGLWLDPPSYYDSTTRFIQVPLQLSLVMWHLSQLQT